MKRSRMLASCLGGIGVKIIRSGGEPAFHMIDGFAPRARITTPKTERGGLSAASGDAISAIGAANYRPLCRTPV